MLASIASSLRHGALALPLLLSACGRDEGSGTQKFESLTVPLLLVMVYVATGLYARRGQLFARTRASR